MLEVLKEPIAKEKSSDETKQVPNLPALFNSLCHPLKYHIEQSEHELDNMILKQYITLQEEIANTIGIMASEGVQDIKD